MFAIITSKTKSGSYCLSMMTPLLNDNILIFILSSICFTSDTSNISPLYLIMSFVFIDDANFLLNFSLLLPFISSPIIWRWKRDLNSQLTAYKTVTLPIELFQHFIGAPDQIRTDTLWILSPLPLPVGLQEHGAFDWIRTSTLLILSQSSLPIGIQRQIGLSHSTLRGNYLRTNTKYPIVTQAMAAVAGFEPTSRGVKVLCLTTWLNRYIE